MHYIYFFIIDIWGENANSDNETKILNEKGTCNFSYYYYYDDYT